MTSRRLGPAVTGLALLLTSACATTQPAARSEPGPVERPGLAATPAPQSGLLLQVEPGEAQVFIDGKPLGRVSDLTAKDGIVPLEPGLYQVSLKCPGYVSWRAEVAVRADQLEQIRIALVKR